MFDSFISKAGMKALALVTVILLISAVTFLTVTRVRGFGMMDENETAASQDNSQAAIFTQNQLNCLKLDDGWWSPIAGPIVIKACGPPTTPMSSPETTKTQISTPSPNQSPATQTETSTASQSTTEPKVETQSTTESTTTSTPQTQTTETSSPPPDVTETKDKEGNSILTSGSIGFTISTIIPKESIQEQKGFAEGVQQSAQQDLDLAEEERKDYNKGLVAGTLLAFGLGEEAAKYKGKTVLSPKELNERTLAGLAPFTSGKSDAYKLGLFRGLGLGSNFVTTFGVSGSPHKQLIK